MNKRFNEWYAGWMQQRYKASISPEECNLVKDYLLSKSNPNTRFLSTLEELFSKAEKSPKAIEYKDTTCSSMCDLLIRAWKSYNNGEDESCLGLTVFGMYAVLN